MRTVFLSATCLPLVIGIEDGSQFALACLWPECEGEGGPRLSFTMLTLNAYHHPLMKRFHKPGSEKRSVIIIQPDDYDDWLCARSIDEARSFIVLPGSESLFCAPAPKERVS